MDEKQIITNMKLLDVPIGKIKFDIEQYAYYLTGTYPIQVELEVSQVWLLSFSSAIGLFAYMIKINLRKIHWIIIFFKLDHNKVIENKNKSNSNLPPKLRIEFLILEQNEFYIIVPNKTQIKVERYCFMLTSVNPFSTEQVNQCGTWILSFKKSLGEFCKKN